MGFGVSPSRVVWFLTITSGNLQIRHYWIFPKIDEISNN